MENNHHGGSLMVIRSLCILWIWIIEIYMGNVSETTTSVNSANFIETGTLKFRLTVTEFIFTIINSITVEKNEDDKSTIAMITGIVQRKMKRSERFFIDAQAKLSPCISSDGKRLQFSWSSYPPLNFTSTKNSRLCSSSLITNRNRIQS